MTQASILGISTFVYFPYCFFNLISPVMSIIISATGYKIKKAEENH
jgi:NhaC family Na+:H+ antiporter